MQDVFSHLPVSAFAAMERTGRDAVAVARLFRIVRRSMFDPLVDLPFTLQRGRGIVSHFDLIRIAG